MLILLTNDDGIYAEGIQALAKELEKEFRVEVVAPEKERSASSHSITLNHPLSTNLIRPGWRMVTGTSADCVNLAINKLLPEKPDIVISGINRGANLGCDLFYSGTVAGAREAGILGLKAFAISLDVRAENPVDYTAPAKFSREFARWLINQPYNSRIIFNINFPSLPKEKIKGVKFTRQGIRVYSSKVQEWHGPDGNKCYLLNGAVLGGKNIEDSDIIAIKDGYISITPLGMDFTDYALLKELKIINPEAYFKID